MTQTAIVGGNVSGNIGSCKIEATNITTSFTHQRTVAVNSCTGDIINDSGEYLNFGIILTITAFSIILSCLVFVVLSDIFKYR